jgi:hypothetical protein
MFIVTIALIGGHTFTLGFKSEEKALKMKKNLENVLMGNVRDTAIGMEDETGKLISFRPGDLVAVGLNQPKAAAPGIAMVVPARSKATSYATGGKIQG